MAAEPIGLDDRAVQLWPIRAAAHVLGVGLVIAVLIALPQAPTDLDRHQLPKETVVHLATWISVLLARPLPVRGMRRAMRWSLILLVAAVIASTIGAENGWLALRSGARIITGIAAFLTARHLAASGCAPILLSWCGAAGVAGAGTGLAQAYGFNSPLFATTRVPGGTFGNRNFMAHFSALALPLMLYTALVARRTLATLAIAVTPALIAAIVLSRSRAAWIASVLSMVVFLLACLAARRRGALPPLGHRPAWLSAMLICGTIAALALPNALAWRSSSPYTDTLVGIANHDEGSGHGRMLQYRNTLQLFARHPVIGVGPGNWPVRYGDVAPISDPSWIWADVIPINPWPSSDWMALLSELGLAGVVAVTLLGISITWRALRGARGHGSTVVAGAALLALLAALIVVSGLDAVMLLPATLLFVACSTGAFLQLAAVDPLDPIVIRQHALGQPLSQTVPRWTQLLPLLLATITLRSMLQTTAYMVAGNGRSLMRLEWANRIDPGSYPLRIALAQRLDCDAARPHIRVALRMARKWPATQQAARRCGVKT